MKRKTYIKCGCGVVILVLIILARPYPSKNTIKYYTVDRLIPNYAETRLPRIVDIKDSTISDDDMYQLLLDIDSLQEYLNGNIVRFRADNSLIGNKTVKFLLTIQGIQLISIRNCSNVTDEAFSEISKECSIRELDIRDCHQISKESFLEIKKILPDTVIYSDYEYCDPIKYFEIRE